MFGRRHSSDVCQDQQINIGNGKPGIRAESFDHPSAFLDPLLIAVYMLLIAQSTQHITS